jgi:predicted Zn-dependent peptidase
MTVRFHQRTLNNGLTVVGEIDPGAHTSAAGFFVKTGARDEATPVMGVSHFLEHMMFKGTDDINAEELNQRFDRIGARNNAYTSNEMTCFYAQLLPEFVPQGLDILSRMMRPALRQADFDTEKGVILEEIAMYQDNPFWVLYEACVEKNFGSHPLSHRVLGTPATIKSLERDQMQAYFDQRYSSDNTVVSLAGNIDFDRACEQVEALCATWTPTRVSRDGARPTLAGGELRLTDAKVNRGYLLAMFDGPAMHDERRYAAALIAQILGAADNSRLHWSLIENGLAEDAQASFDPHDGFGEYFVFATGEPDRLDEIWEVIQKELATLRDSMTQDDVDRLLTKLATSVTLSGERPGDRMQRLGRLWTYLGRYMPLEAELEQIRKVTLKELRETFDAFPLRPITVGRLTPA